MSTRSCKGYLVDCKNPAVKGRLFCFTCAGRKSRNKKTLALESFEKECMSLRLRVAELEPEVVSTILNIIYDQFVIILCRMNGSN